MTLADLPGPCTSICEDKRLPKGHDVAPGPVLNTGQSSDTGLGPPGEATCPTGIEERIAGCCAWVWCGYH